MHSARRHICEYAMRLLSPNTGRRQGNGICECKGHISCPASIQHARRNHHTTLAPSRCLLLSRSYSLQPAVAGLCGNS